MTSWTHLQHKGKLMDISIFDYESKAEAGYEVAITHPQTGKPTDIVFDVYGSDSRTLENARVEYIRALRENEENGDADKVLAALCQFLASATKSFRGMQENDEEVTYSHQSTVDIFYRYKGIREQIDTAIAQRSRLFQSDKEG